MKSRLGFLWLAAMAGFFVQPGCKDTTTTKGGGECSANNDCGEDEYCEKTTGDCDGTGECTQKPSECPEIWAPVCGCDNVTYENSCYAARNGVNVLHEGECVSNGECTENHECGEDEYCEKGRGDCDGTGECSPIPVECPDIWAPICGCDNVTYENWCDAARNGVNVLHEGECVSNGECTENHECGEDEYCEKERGDCDGTGECTQKPEDCPAVYDPVCGCDNATYGNSCDAAANGVNVLREGECIAFE